MNVTEKLSRFLEHRIPYMIEAHPMDSIDPNEEKETPRGPCECLARSVAVKVDGKVCIVVTKASEDVDLQHLGEYLGAESVTLVSKEEFRRLFSDCDAGSMPIFGSLYGLPVLVPHELTDNEEIAFPAGTPGDLIRIRLRDFLITEKPCICARNAILAKAS